MATLAVTRPRPRRGRTCVRHVGGAKISIVFYTGQAQSMRPVETIRTFLTGYAGPISHLIPFVPPLSICVPFARSL